MMLVTSVRHLQILILNSWQAYILTGVEMQLLMFHIDILNAVLGQSHWWNCTHARADPTNLRWGKTPRSRPVACISWPGMWKWQVGDMKISRIAVIIWILLLWLLCQILGHGSFQLANRLVLLEDCISTHMLEVWSSTHTHTRVYRYVHIHGPVVISALA